MDWKGDNVNEPTGKEGLFDTLSKKFGDIYNYKSVILNHPISVEMKDELRKRGLATQEWERLSEKHLSYFNLLQSVSTNLERNTVPMNSKTQHYKYNISRINRNKTTGNELIVYNTLKDSWKTVLLDNFRPMKNPCKHHTYGMKSNYYFIYDNQGIIHVIFDNMQICELALPDGRLDPTLYVYEKNADQSILFVAGGYIMKNGGIVVLDNIAVFYLNFKELCKLLKHEPLYYIKMKFQRMNPSIFKYKKDNELMFLFLGGNNVDKVHMRNKELSRKSLIPSFDDVNLFCESISFKKIKDCIFKSDFNQSQMINTEDSLLVNINGKSLEECKNEKLRYYLDEGAVIKYKAKKNHKKLSYLLGVGKNKDEIWIIDKVDFREHKIYLYKSKQHLTQKNNDMFCRNMITTMGSDLFYFNHGDAKELKYKKMHFKSNYAPSNEGGVCGNSECNIF